MLKPFHNMLVIFFVLFALFEQTITQSVFASHQPSSASISQDKITITSLSAEHSDDECCNIECCEATCICPENSCVPPLFLPSLVSSIDITMLIYTQLHSDVQPVIFIPTSLYRPPIFIS